MPATAHVSQRIATLPNYAFAEVDAAVTTLREQGIEPIDFGVGDPSDPTPAFIRRACQEGVDRHAASGYPSYVGSPAFREAVANWTQRRFGVELDPATEIASSVGSKEAIFNAAEAFVDPNDVVLCPTPGYPPYQRGTLFAEGQAVHIPLREQDGFLPDLDAIPSAICARAKLLWINYPNSPTGRVATLAELQSMVNWARKHNIIVCSDEAYSEIYFTDTPPPTALQCGKDGVLVFQSLSKRSMMTGYRIGWVAGDPALVGAFKQLKTNIDSGTPWFVQDAAVAALGDETHVAEARDLYRTRRDLMVEALAAAGLPPVRCEGTFYLWQRIPEHLGTGLDFAKQLLAPEVAVVCTPGAWISTPLPDGSNPGESYVRFALVASLEDTQRAAERIAAMV